MSKGRDAGNRQSEAYLGGARDETEAGWSTYRNDELPSQESKAVSKSSPEAKSRGQDSVARKHGWVRMGVDIGRSAAT